MKAKHNPAHPTKYNRSHRKENGGFMGEYTVIDLSPPRHPPQANAPIFARVYHNTSKSANTVCMWVAHKDLYIHASGEAKGYGFHRPSEALENAITNAGFTLSEPIGGVGEGAMENALLAIAKCIGVKRPAIHRSHP